MWTVGIETSGREGGVALLCDDELIAARSLSREGQRHARTLVAELQHMFLETGVAPRGCHVVAVSLGPGSFTGLRVGVMCAKTWAFAAGCRLIGVDTFEAVAERVPAEVREIDVIADAQRGDLYLGRYARPDSATWTLSEAVRIVAGDVWLSGVTPDRVVTGPAVPAWQDRLIGRGRVLSPAMGLPQAADIARIGRREALAGRAADMWSLEPIYIRRSAAEEKAAGDGT